MTTDEFNALACQLCEGLPRGLVLTRLLLTLWGVVQAGGDPAAELLRAAVTGYRARDEQRRRENGGPAPRPPRRP